MLLISYVLATLVVSFACAQRYFSRYGIDLNFTRKQSLELAKIWLYNLTYYGVFEFIRSSITQSADEEGRVLLGYLFIVLSLVVSVWTIISSYYFPDYLRNLMSDDRGYVKVLKRLLFTLTSLFVLVIVTQIGCEQILLLSLNFEIIYLYIAMSVAGIFGSFSVARDELSSFFAFAVVAGFVMWLSTMVVPLSMATLGGVFFGVITLRQIYIFRPKLFQRD